MEDNFYTVRELKVSYCKKGISKNKVTSSKDASDYFQLIYNEEYGIEFIECFYAIYLSRNNNVIGWKRIGQGGIDGTVADVRLVMNYAIQCLASGIIVCHNHPSGNLKPSASDISLTSNFKKAADLFNMNLLDHLILSDQGYYSFADEGTL